MKVDYYLYINGWNDLNLAGADLAKIIVDCKELGLEVSAVLVPNTPLYMIIFKTQDDLNAFKIMADIKPLISEYGRPSQLVYDYNFDR